MSSYVILEATSWKLQKVEHKISSLILTSELTGWRNFNNLKYFHTGIIVSWRVLLKKMQWENQSSDHVRNTKLPQAYREIHAVAAFPNENKIELKEQQEW